ncbi:MAG: sulfatase-like hydrolase/transferase, partial [Candidatus Latescibacteria bacterium]|nr:sulfatase-like hydrolase/transferase [Candidatus Latescibacterota bacterium]
NAVPDTRPNIVLITTDQHRGDCLGIEGHPVLQTPYLDWIGASGVRFSRAYSACPVCVPARRTMMTGRRPVNQGLLMNGNAPLTGPTLPDMLTEAGYRTHLVAKGHFGPSPTEIGFETACWADGPRAGGDNAYQQFLKDNGVDWPRASDAHGMPSNGYPVRSWHLDERFHFTNWCADEAVRFLEVHDTDRPFFLSVNFLHPHQPHTPPAFYYDRYMAMELPEPYVGDWARVFDGPVRGLNPECWRMCVDEPVIKQMRAAYYGCINHIDNQIARFILRYVLPPNTVVVFTSDHGEMLGDHQWIRKRNPYEPSARIPMLWRFPDDMGVPQEHVIDRPVELMDIMPTLLEVAGVPVPDSVDGESLLPLIQDGNTPWREYLHGECAEVPSTDSGMQYLTDGRCKYVWLPGQGAEQFFDLETDPREMTNLADNPDYAAEIAMWRQRLIDELEGRPEGFTDGKRLLKLDGPTPGKAIKD